MRRPAVVTPLARNNSASHRVADAHEFGIIAISRLGASVVTVDVAKLVKAKLDHYPEVEAHRPPNQFRSLLESDVIDQAVRIEDTIASIAHSDAISARTRRHGDRDRCDT